MYIYYRGSARKVEGAEASPRASPPAPAPPATDAKPAASERERLRQREQERRRREAVCICYHYRQIYSLPIRTEQKYTICINIAIGGSDGEYLKKNIILKSILIEA